MIHEDGEDFANRLVFFSSCQIANWLYLSFIIFAAYYYFLQFDANKFYSFIHTRGFVYLLGNSSQQTTTHVQNKSTLIFCWTHHYQVPMIKLFSVCTVQYRTFLRYFTYRKEWWNNEKPPCYDFTRKGRPRELL